MKPSSFLRAGCKKVSVFCSISFFKKYTLFRLHITAVFNPTKVGQYSGSKTGYEKKTCKFIQKKIKNIKIYLSFVS